jgi:GH15 family glucan-1,4-alpha-glucosidase
MPRPVSTEAGGSTKRNTTAMDCARPVWQRPDWSPHRRLGCGGVDRGNFPNSFKPLDAMIEPPPEQPISAYAVVGNLRSIALVGLNGSVDWCCLPHLDSPSVFGGILDRNRGGRFHIAPATEYKSRQRYWRETNVLETVFETAGGRLVVTDWMPLSGNIDGCGKSKTEPTLYRRLHCEGSGVEVALLWAPRLDYGRATTEITRVSGGFLASDRDGRKLALPETFPNAVIADDGCGPCVRATFRLAAGDEPLLIATRWDVDDARLDIPATIASLETTADVWRQWIDKQTTTRVRKWAAIDPELILRSELALRLLTHGETGAIAAAATTSLPEDIGGVRNWDYRFAWIRDSSQLIESFMALGHRAEVLDFLHFAERVSQHREHDNSIHIMYGLHGELDCPETTLDHWAGYRQSRPVRIGNGGFRQNQHDVYGEILNSAYELARLGEPLQPEMRSFLSHVADQACEKWANPDYGIWEMRGEPRHYVYSKMMIWVALDRAVQLAERYGLTGELGRWKRERERVRAAILREGYSEEVGAFVQAFGSQDVDAANLMLPMMEFLPFDDPRIQNTIDRTIERLTENELVYRYRVDDGLEGEEGAFGLMSFWLVDALAFSGRLDGAHRYFDAIVRRANHVGLLSEQIDPSTGELLGNFPQALTHIGLIDSAIHLAHLEGTDAPIEAPIGSHEHREELGRS